MLMMQKWGEKDLKTFPTQNELLQTGRVQTHTHTQCTDRNVGGGEASG